MEAKKAKLFATISVVVLIGLLIVLIILATIINERRHLVFIVLPCVDVVLIVAFSIWLMRLYGVAESRKTSMQCRIDIEGQQLRAEYSFMKKVAKVPTKFRYEELVAATDNFGTLIGRGSSAMVFKGILDGGTAVAVKQLLDWNGQGDRDFRTEVAAIANIHHVNLIRLLGYCIPSGKPRFLVYEFVANGSLDRWIFHRQDDGDVGRCLPWYLRYQVAVHVARALEYLQKCCRNKVLHLDVKPENILLDEAFHAVMSDFGLSKLMPLDESRVMASAVRGTRGYLAPEWVIGAGINEKCDVYSYGIVLLEMVAGQRNLYFPEKDFAAGHQPKRRVYLPEVFAKFAEEGKVMDLVDKRLMRGREAVVEKQVDEMVRVALWCVQEDPSRRPSMDLVVEMLEGKATVPAPPLTNMLMLNVLEDCAGETSAPARNRILVEMLRIIREEDPEMSGSSHATYEMSMISAR